MAFERTFWQAQIFKISAISEKKNIRKSPTDMDKPDLTTE